MYRLENENALYIHAITIVLLLVYFLYNKWKQKKFNVLADSHLLENIVLLTSKSKSFFKFLVFIISINLLIFSYVNLQVGGKVNKEARQETIDMILAVDISHSMLAEDVKPNRLESVKFLCMRLADEIKFAKTGIILFAGDAYIHMPVTSDVGALKMFVSSISTDLISMQGTAIGKALILASDAFNRNESNNKAVVLITDGENFEDDAVQAAQIAVKNNIVIHAVSIGMPEGAPIPIKQNGKIITFKKDADNETVISKPDFDLLKKIANNSNGIFVNGNNSSKAVDELKTELEKLEREKGDSIMFANWDSLFHLFAFPALLLLIIDFFIIERKMKWQKLFQSLLNISLVSNKKKRV